MQSTILQSCLHNVGDQAAGSFTRVLDASVKVMQEAEAKSLTSARRNELALAWRTLLVQQDALVRRYPDLLRGALDGESAVSTKAVENPQKAFLDSAFAADSQLFDEESGFGDSDLSLVDDTQLSQTIETARLLQRVTAILDPKMPVVDGLISAALGLPHIAPSLNPLRPEVFVRTVRGLLSDSGAEAAVVTTWFANIAQPLADEIQMLYDQVVKQLRAAGLQPVKYKVSQTPGKEGFNPNATGVFNPNATGQFNPNATGQFNPNMTGQFNPNGTGVFNANATGQFVPGGGMGGMGGAAGGFAGGGTGVFPGGEMTQGIQVVDLSDGALSGHLMRQFFVSAGAPAAMAAYAPMPAHTLSPAFYATVDREIAEIRESEDTEILPDSAENYREIPSVERPKPYVDDAMALNASRWGEYARAKRRALLRAELKRGAKRAEQVFGIEMVRQLVNQVARDVRLLGAMREAIVALEPSLARLAMVDPRFFSDNNHAGRRLIERVAQRSFRYNDELAGEFTAFFDPVSAAFNELNQIVELADAQPFEETLAALEKSWSEQDQAEIEKRNAAVQAMRFAEDRQALANQLAFDISQRTDLDLVPAVVLDFLYNRWTLVMAHARLTDTKAQLDPGGYGSLISDLLWSTKHDLTLNQPSKLVQLIPPMLRKLGEGLDMLGEDPAEKFAFFATLERLHKPVLELLRTRSRQDGEKPSFKDTLPAAPEAPATAEERKAKPKATPWLGKKVLEEVGIEAVEVVEAGDSKLESGFDSAYGSSGFDANAEDAARIVEAADAAAAAQADGAEAEAGAPADDGGTPAPDKAVNLTPSQIIKGLKLGGWVDLFSQHDWRRAQLVWASTRRTLFMFESQNGRPHSMTRRSCERLIRSRQLRPLDMHEVVARALQVIAREAAGDEAIAAEMAEAAAVPDIDNTPGGGGLPPAGEGPELSLQPSN
jgi:hypothetical protein